MVSSNVDMKYHLASVRTLGGAKLQFGSFMPNIYIIHDTYEASRKRITVECTSLRNSRSMIG